MSSRSIPKEMMHNTCKMGQQEKCCRYMLVEPDEGIICAKHDKYFGPVLKAKDDMVAKADNCEGLR